MSGELREGQIVGGRFVVKRKLGQGGFGTVWLAADHRGGQDVALKVLHERFVANPWVLDRFRREGEVLTQLDHAGVARLVAASADTEGAYLAMEFVPGRSLDLEISDRALARSHYPLEEVARLLDSIAAAVQYAHSLSIVHRDLKPKNVQIRRDRGGLELKVLDFGVAKIIGDTGNDATTVGRLLGSLLYMSPEQAMSAPVDHRADIFSLGTLLFELLTLRRTWALDASMTPLWAIDQPIPKDQVNNHLSILRRIAQGPRPALCPLRPELPEVVEAVVLRALAIDPRERYASAAELADAFRLAALPSGARRVQPFVPLPAATGGGPPVPLDPEGPTPHDPATLLVRQRSSVPRRERAPDPEAEPEDGLTSVMPKDHDARDLVGGTTRAALGATRPVVRIGVEGDPALTRLSSGSFPGAPPRGASALSAVGPAPRRGPSTAVTLLVGIAIGAVLVAVAGLLLLPDRAAPTPVVLPSDGATAEGTLRAKPATPAPAPRVPAAPEPAPASPPEVARREARPSRAPRAPPEAPRPEPAPAPTPTPAADPYAGLRRVLEAARARRDDGDALSKLAEAIEKAAATLPDPRRSTLRRRASMSRLRGDFDGLEACAREILAGG